MNYHFNCVNYFIKLAVIIIILLSTVQIYYTVYKPLQYSSNGLKFAIETSRKTEIIQTVHLAFVVDNTKYLGILLKSLLLYRHNPLHFHFLANETEQLVVETLLNTWQLQSVSYSFYPLGSFIRSALLFNSFNVAIDKMKLTLLSILPSSVNKVIILDTKLLLMSGIHELWTIFDILKIENKMFAAVKKPIDCQKHQEFDECFETSVMLFDIQSMREMNIIHQLRNSEYLYEYWLYELPCEWSLQFHDKKCGNDNYRAIQYQCICDFKSQNTQYSLLKSDSYLLQYLAVGYDRKKTNVQMYNLTIYEDVCNNVKEQSKKRFLTHLFYYGKLYNSIDRHDVTLVTQMSINRVHMLHKLLKYWKGPASISMYGIESDIIEHFRTYNTLNGRTNVAIHVVYKRKGYYYPINYLRNTALSVVKTHYVFLTDLDFLPSYNLYFYLKKAAEILMTVSHQRALVVPAFEAIEENLIFPKYKSMLLRQMSNLSIQPFHSHFKGHYATNYTKWITTSYPYVTNWVKDYEPYILVKSNVVKYDERFIGYGRNKIAHIAELKAQGYEFVVLPDPFLIHYPHPLSDDHMIFKNKFLKMCIKNLYNTTYLDELHKKYGPNCLESEEKRETKDILIKITV